MTGPLAALLVLADSRLPAGGHAHSGGLEAAVATGRVDGLAGLDRFLRGRLATAGLVAAAFAAAACARPAAGARLDAGLDARIPSPAARRASRAQGRALLRAGRALWPTTIPHLTVDPGEIRPGSSASRDERLLDRREAGGWHHPVALGLVAAAAGCTPGQAAVTAAYGAVAGPAGAAVRLLGLDPYRVHALLAALAPACDEVAAAAATTAHQPVDALPAAGAPLLDLYAEAHATWEVRLFAS
jgi:urease accessory protein